MLCPGCRRQVAQDATYCKVCGRSLTDGSKGTTFELVLADGKRVPVAAGLTIGRADGSALQIKEPTVSRTHARVNMGAHGYELEDAGSSHGTFLDGERLQGPVALRDGSVLRVGDVELKVVGRRADADAGRTIVVAGGMSALMPSVGTAPLGPKPVGPAPVGPAPVGATPVGPAPAGAAPAGAAPIGAAPAAAAQVGTAPAGATTTVGLRPRVRSGYALKRLEADEGDKRWILRDLKGGGFTRMGDEDAELFRMLDGQSTLLDLITQAEARFGSAGPGRLARLLADLGERGLLSGIEATSLPSAPQGRLARLFGPREKATFDAGPLFERAYERGGWLLFMRPVLGLLALIAVGGIGSFVYLVAGRYGTPFVVAAHLGLGGAIFMAGRFFLVALHELAHGLTMASFGRRVGRAGLKLFFILPYAFVDTSEAWFERRSRRIAVSAAGPAADLTLGGAFSLACLAAGPGTLRDILFQLAFGAYIGAFFNLNPFLDRDGYHIAVDVLREPGLRKRSREQLSRRLSGGGASAQDSPVVLRFAVLGVIWLVLVAGFVIVFSQRYYPVVEHFAPKGVVVAVFGVMYAVLFIPVLFTVGRPLWQRRTADRAGGSDGAVA